MKDIEDEIPFEVPEGWAWCKAKQLYNIRSAIRIHQSDWQSNGIPFFRGRELVELCKTGTVHPEIFISEELYEENKKKGGIPQKNDLLVSAVGTLGFVHIVEGTKKFYYKDAYILCFENHFNLNPFYMKKVIESDFIQKVIYGGSKGTTVDQLTIENAKDLWIPFPPENEQKKLVSELDRLFLLIDSIENDKIDLQTAIKQAKSKILDLAIHGKLVPQDSSDEPASVLLERLREEKEAKIAKGELKRDKNDSYIYKNTTDNCHYQKFVDGTETDISDEIPFEIPDNWSWCNLGEIYSHTTGKALKKENNKGTLRKYITTSNLYWNSFDFTDVRTMYFTDDELEKCTIKKGDLVLCNGGDVGRAAIWKLDEDICYQNHVSRLRPKLSGINNSFYLYVIQINKEKGNLSGKGVGITSLSATDILNLKIPLPPLAEQKRIVEKIENAFAKLDYIAEQLA
ncbi:MAG: restriction endonuclease subunit S [Treponema sp.]|nr:restriction endonuclease subunit S [Treponema sp.]